VRQAFVQNMKKYTNKVKARRQSHLEVDEEENENEDEEEEYQEENLSGVVASNKKKRKLPEDKINSSDQRENRIGKV
jgi:hypothetical protein